MKYLRVISLLSVAGVFIVASEDVTPVNNLRPASARFSDFEASDAASFRRQVIPLLSRAGCSSRECHGAFSGQGGFQLSLFGYDFDKDHKEITVDQEDGVRINPEDPEKSLVLLKPTLQEKHKGKERIKKGSWEYNLLLNWIRAGAKNDVKETGEFDRLEVFPKEIIFQQPGDTLQLRVLAHWKDGAVEDVTELTRFRSNDDSIAVVSEKGRVEAKEKGDTHIVAFYDNGVSPVPVILPVSDNYGAKYPDIVNRTKVDELIDAKLRKLGILPSEVCNDAEFLRRLSLDLTGTLPAVDDVVRFLADPSPGKRAAKTEELLQSPAYAAWWTTKLCDYTGNSPRTLNTGGAGLRNYQQLFSRQWYDWIYKRVAGNLPYDQLAEGIILAVSRTRAEQSYKEYALEMASYFRPSEPADFTTRPNMPYFWQRRTVTKPEEKALAFAHTFLGVRIECAQCHKHPFDQWTKTDFEQFQGFFEPVRFGSGPAKRDEEVSFQSVQKEIRERIADVEEKEKQRAQQTEIQRRIEAGEVAPWQEVFIAQRPASRPRPKQEKNQDLFGRVLTPKILGGQEVLLQQYNDPRQPLMDWLRNTKNPYFARAFVNRVWANYFGRGIVEPADDMNLANPPVNKELLDYLADGFVAHEYDMKWVHREIVNSAAYQRSWQPTPSNKFDEKNFSRFVLRRLAAEVVVDAIALATAGSEQVAKFASEIDSRAIGPNTEATGRAQAGNRTLAIFGRPTRETNCDCERTTDPTLLQTIYTRNDPEMLAQLEAARNSQLGWIAELRQAHKPARVDAKKTPRTEPIAIPSLEGARLDKVIAEAFLRTVSRPPTEREIAEAREDVATASDPINGIRDLLWALLNTREFIVNH